AQACQVPGRPSNNPISAQARVPRLCLPTRLLLPSVPLALHRIFAYPSSISFLPSSITLSVSPDLLKTGRLLALRSYTQSFSLHASPPPASLPWAGPCLSHIPTLSRQTANAPHHNANFHPCQAKDLPTQPEVLLTSDDSNCLYHWPSSRTQ